MAVTIDKRAPLHSMAYNENWWVVRSTNSAQSNFRFVCDVYVNGQTFAGNSFLRLKTPVDPVQNKGIFNPNRILETFLSYDISVASAGQEAIKQASHSVIQYTLKFGEEYGPSSAVIVTPDLAVTGQHYLYNGCIDYLDYIDFINTSGSAFLNESVTNKKFLTSFPRTNHIKIRASENAWLQILNNEAANNSSRAHYVAYDSTFSVILSTLVINNNFRLLSNIEDRRIIIPVGWNIDNINPADIISGTVPFVGANGVQFWRAWMTDTAGNTVSEVFAFEKDNLCTTTDEFRLHFLNAYGAFDSFTFTKESAFSTDIKERKTYDKPPGKFISSTNYMYEAADRQRVVFYTELKDGIILNSDWISESTMKWLEELVTSPVVFVENVTWSTSGNTITMVPVVVTDKKFERKKRSSSKLFNLQMKIEPTNNRYRQRA